MIFGQLADAAIITGAVETLAGRKAALPYMLRNGFSRLLAVVLCAILVSLLISLGGMLLLIPGLMAMAAFAVAIPAVVIEGKGPTEALERSLELTSGNRWQVFGVIILIGIINILLSLLLGAFGNMINADSLPISVAGYFVQTGISVGLGGAYGAALYTHLREAKEGASVDEIVSVFS